MWKLDCDLLEPSLWYADVSLPKWRPHVLWGPCPVCPQF